MTPMQVPTRVPCTSAAATTAPFQTALRPTLVRRVLSLFLSFILCVLAFPFSRTIPASGTGAASDSYQGYAVASSGNVLAVGAPQCQITVSGTITGQNGNGFVSMYSCTAGNVCSAPSTISGSSYSNGCFGWSVGLTSSGQLLAIGAPGYS